MRFRWVTAILLAIAVMFGVAFILLFQSPSERSASERTYSELLRIGPKLRSATIIGDDLIGRDDDGIFTVRLPRDSTIADRLAQNGTDVMIREKPDVSVTVSLLTNWLPFVAYMIVLGVPLFRVARALEAIARQGLRIGDRRA